MCKNNYCVQEGIAAFACLMLTTTCNERDINKVFPQEKQLYAVKIPVNEVVDIERSDMVIVKNHIVLTSPRTDTLIYIYSLPDFNLVKCFGKTGQGPNDFYSPDIVDNNTDDLFLFGNSNLNSLKKFNVVASTDNELVLKEYELTDINYGIRNLSVINDSVLFFFDGMPYSLSVKSYDLILNKHINRRELKVTEDHDLDWAYSNNGVLSANGHTVAYAYLYQNKIEFMQHDFSIKKVVRGLQNKTLINLNDESDNRLYYLGYYAGDDFFYFLFQGYSENEREGRSKSIEVYDRNGNPVIRYILDHVIYNFTVDENNHRIYAKGDDEDNIYVFEMQ